MLSNQSCPRYFLPSLSVTVITLNEAKNIAACLRSVAFADQLIVLDSGSTDGTVELARACGAEVTVNHEWPGFGIQKNRAVALAHSEWVLSLDADERVTPGLKDEIIAAMQAPTADVYSIGRLSKYCGQYMYHSGWYPDLVTRLFRKDSAHFTKDMVHERLVTHKHVGRLSSLIVHESFCDFESVLEKVNRYSSAGASMAVLQGKKSSVAKAIFRGLWAFFRTYVLRLGFLDGQMGLVLAISNGEGTYYRYLKIWLIQKNFKASIQKV